MPHFRTICLLFVFLLGAISISCNRKSVNKQAGSEDLGETAYAINISEDGIYVVDLKELNWPSGDSQTGLTHAFRLTQAAKLIPYRLDGDLLVFYGIGPDSRYANARTYVLQAGVPGKLMESRSLVDGSLTSTNQIWNMRHYEENKLYDGAAAGANPELDPWFWKTIQVSSKVNLEFDLPKAQISQARLRLALWGVTENPSSEFDHNLEIFINEQSVGGVQWDGQAYFTGVIELNPNTLRPGSNTLSFTNQQGSSSTIDISRIDWFEIDYLSAPVPENDFLFLPGVSGEITLRGFSGKPAVFDITDRQQPVFITGWDYVAESLTLTVNGSRNLLVVGPEGYLEADKIGPEIISDLRSEANQADMLIIADVRLQEPLEPLVEARRSQSLNVRQVTLSEIYGSFGDGQSGPDSIRDFLSFALSHWSEPHPRYLLLVGDASYDYRGYLSDEIESFIPAPMVRVQYSGETVSDNSLADMDGDGQPELAVGRWPVSEPEEVASLVNRTLAYEQNQAADQAMFVADNTSSEFANLNQSVLGESGFITGEVNLISGGDMEDLLQAWNAGAWLVNYAGHGSLDRWGKAGFLVNDHINDLSKTPTSPPIVVQLTCLTGYFAHPSFRSLSEELLLNENGPVLIVGASSLTLSEDQQPFGANLLRQLNDTEVLRFGDAFLQAKVDLDLSTNPGLKAVSETFNLFGDPATIIVRPGQG